MSTILPEPTPDPARNYFSQQCVLASGIASGAVTPTADERHNSAAYLMGRRDAFHVVVAHLASSRSLREAAEKSAAFGRGLRERSTVHPYGADWCDGFAGAAFEAALDITMYAATGTLPMVDRERLQEARVAVRKFTPLSNNAWVAPTGLDEPPASRREW